VDFWQATANSNWAILKPPQSVETTPP